MGTYTCLRFIGKLKSEYKKDIIELFVHNQFHKLDRESNNYDEWSVFAEKHQFASSFSKLPRATSIPFGVFTYYNSDKFTSGLDPDLLGFSNIVECETWVFQCDLKDYDNEIEAFLSDIAPNICERFIAEIWTEESEFPQLITKGITDQ